MRENLSQYTIRDIPKSVDAVFRRKAKAEGKSLNRVVLEALISEANVALEGKAHHDLDHLIDTWVADPATDRALRGQRKVDPKDWR
jgi:hypothetical protein